MKSRTGKMLFALVLLAALAGPAQAVLAGDTGAEALFAEANQAYAKGDYDAALARYQDLAGKHGVSAPLYFNTASAWYHKKNPGQAVLNFERALLLSPTDKDARASLNLARKDFGIAAPPEPLIERIFGALSLDQWTIWAAGAFAAFCLLFFINQLVPEPGEKKGLLSLRAALRWGPALCLAVFLCAGAGVFAHASDLKKAVVIADGARLQVSPFETAQSAASVKQGKLFYTGKAYGGYVHVTDRAGRTGWLKQTDVTPVAPR